MLQGGPRETRLEWLWQRLGGADKKGQAWEGTLRWADPARNLVPGCSAASNQPHWGAGFTSVEWGQSSAQVGVCRGSTIWVPPLAPHAPQAPAFQLPARPSGWGEGQEEVPSQRAKPGGLSPLPGPRPCLWPLEAPGFPERSCALWPGAHRRRWHHTFLHLPSTGFSVLAADLVSSSFSIGNFSLFFRTEPQACHFQEAFPDSPQGDVSFGSLWHLVILWVVAVTTGSVCPGAQCTCSLQPSASHKQVLGSTG